MSDLPHSVVHVVHIEDLDSLFPEGDFDEFLDYLSYVWEVTEDIDDEYGDCALFVSKDWLMRRACDFGVTEDTLQSLEAHLFPEFFIQIDLPSIAPEYVEE